MPNRIFLKSLLSFFFLTGSISFADSSCLFVPTLKKEVLNRSALAESAKNSFENFRQIQNEASHLKQISSGVAISSGLLLLAPGMSLLNNMRAMYHAGLVGHIYVGSRIAPAFLGGLLAANLHIESTLLGNSIVLLLSHPDAVYFISTGFYQILKSGEVATIDLNEVGKSEVEIQKIILQLASRIESLLENPPSTFANSLSLGGKNADHFSQVSQLAEIRARLLFDLLEISKAKLTLMEKSCQN